MKERKFDAEMNGLFFFILPPRGKDSLDVLPSISRLTSTFPLRLLAAVFPLFVECKVVHQLEHSFFCFNTLLHMPFTSFP